MQNKIKTIKKYFFFAAAVVALIQAPVSADVADDDLWAEELVADAIADYEVEGTLFQKIADLEQEKVLMQLEKERAQLDLELDRLAAEKIKLHMEIDTLSGRAEEQQLALDAERAKLEAETAKLEREKQNLATRATEEPAKRTTTRGAASTETESDPISKKYRLVDIIGAGNQLHATVEDAENGQRKKISVGKILDGYTIKSISLDDGVVFVKDGIAETLNIGKETK
ncbi:MAG: type IV pilus biogenesis protein PilP [Rickettsiales bacterium]|jgi:type IV pilus biogenesis protein PilP|nr:type IV pilus biogenesis protein PilP [Rickettsiales bacterium]